MSKQIEEVMALADEFALKTDAYQNDEVSREDLFAARRAVKDKLRELLPVWQPIETAPKDGSFGIYWSKNHGANVWNRPEGCAGGIWKIVDGRLCGHACHGFDEATHWMPLPAPPSQEGAT